MLKSLLLLALISGAGPLVAAEVPGAPPAPDNAAWTACLAAPKRGCVFDEALRVAQTLKEVGPHAVGLAIVATAQSRAGQAQAAAADLKLAVEALASVTGGSDRDELLMNIATAQAEMGGLPDALHAAQSIKAADSRARALIEVAAAQSEAGLAQDSAATFEEAIGAAESLEPRWQVVSALAYIGTRQEQARLRKEAAATFAKAVNAAQSDSDLESLAKQLADAGDFDEALQLAQSNPEAFERSLALDAVAEAQASAGKIAEALRTAQSIPDDPLRGESLAAVAAAQARAGRAQDAATLLAQAQQLAQSASGERRAGALAAVAAAQAEAGLTTESAATFEQALLLAQGEPAGYSRDVTLRVIAKALAKSGKAAQAMEVAGLIADTKGIRLVTLISIADEQFKAGKFAEGLRTVEPLDSGVWRIKKLTEIALKLPT